MAVNFYRDVYCLLGLPFDSVTMESALRRVRGAARSRTQYRVATANLNWLIACQSDRRFRESGIVSNLVTADGMPVAWMA